MDVHCSTCNEPWDAHHLRHDAIFETDIDPEEAEAWLTLRSSEQLSPRYREMFKATGYEFGGSILNVQHCPCCPKGAKPDPEKAAMKAGIVEILGDDEDAIASTFEDFGL
jgi:hypothetical protein